jgi:hypothetical protein
MPTENNNSNAVSWITGIPLLAGAGLSFLIPGYISNGERAFAEHHVMLPAISQFVIQTPRLAWVVGVIIIAIVALVVSLRVSGKGLKASICIMGDMVMALIYSMIYLGISLPLYKISHQLS